MKHRRLMVALILVLLMAGELWAPLVVSAAWLGSSAQASSGGTVLWRGLGESSSILWQTRLTSAATNGPLVDAVGNIYVAGDNWVAGRRADGTMLWESDSAHIRPGSLALFDHPQLGTQLLLTTASPDVLQMRAPETGAIAWSAQLPAPAASPTLAGRDGRVYLVTNDGRFRAFSASGSALWSYCLGRAVTQPMAIAANGYVLAVSTTGTVTAIDPTHHAVRWRCETDSIPATGPVIAPDGSIYVCSSTGQVVKIGVSGGIVWRQSLGAANMPTVTGSGDLWLTGADGNLRLLNSAGQVLRTVALGVSFEDIHPVLDTAGVLHAAAGQAIIRVSQDGTPLSPVALGGTCDDWAFPADGTAIAVTDAGELICLGPSPADDGAGTAWQPTFGASAPDGLAGWYRSPATISVTQASPADWPAGVEVVWHASAAGVEASGTLSPASPAAQVGIEGQVAVVFTTGGPTGRMLGQLNLPIDLSAPKISLVGAEGNTVFLEPGATVPQIAVSETGSGAGPLEMVLDGAPWLESLPVTAGTHTLILRAVDLAGNQAEAEYRIIAGKRCAAMPLTPIVGTLAPTTAPIWSRWVTVMLRLPQDQEPSPQSTEVELGGVGGTVIARLPVVAGAGYRAYIARFDRAAVTQAIAARAPAGARRLTAVMLELTVLSGSTTYCAPVRLLWRP